MQKKLRKTNKDVRTRTENKNRLSPDLQKYSLLLYFAICVMELNLNTIINNSERYEDFAIFEQNVFYSSFVTANDFVKFV